MLSVSDGVMYVCLVLIAFWRKLSWVCWHPPTPLSSLLPKGGDCRQESSEDRGCPFVSFSYSLKSGLGKSCVLMIHVYLVSKKAIGEKAK